MHYNKLDVSKEVLMLLFLSCNQKAWVQKAVGNHFWKHSIIIKHSKKHRYEKNNYIFSAIYLTHEHFPLQVQHSYLTEQKLSVLDAGGKSQLDVSSPFSSVSSAEIKQGLHLLLSISMFW